MVSDWIAVYRHILRVAISASWWGMILKGEFALPVSCTGYQDADAT